jgi:predicted cobalt transporter CbtA
LLIEERLAARQVNAGQQTDWLPVQGYRKSQELAGNTQTVVGFVIMLAAAIGIILRVINVIAANISGRVTSV